VLDTAAKKLLLDGLQALAITPPEHAVEKLLLYVDLLQKWNQRFNLTALHTTQEIVIKHLLDSLTIHPFLKDQATICDVGTGAGLPGIPLSIFNQDKKIVLLDSNHKKHVFLLKVTSSLSLRQVQCVCSLVERYDPQPKFSTIVTRAFAPLGKMLALTTHLLDERGRFFAMMGKAPQLEELPTGYEFEQIITLKVPFETAQRHLAIVAKRK